MISAARDSASAESRLATSDSYAVRMAFDDLRMNERPALRAPIMITAFRGWNDGGQAATVAAGYLAQQWGATRFADIDPEGFVDFQAVRPTVSLDEGLTRRIEWPENAFFHAEIPGRERDVVILLGVEPNYRWRAFTDVVVGLARDLGVELVVTLGALLADVPHTRPAPVTGAATDPKLVEELGLQLSRYEGPTGIVGVLHDACRVAELRSVSLWSAVPHYVSLAPSPRAAKALCVRLADLVGVPIETAELDEAEEEYAAQVSEAVASDPDTQAYVEELERRADSIESFAEGGELPSGETLAAELTRFLRERERKNDPPET
jgi:proteasome assembly chaperone (PAC2) family protein